MLSRAIRFLWSVTVVSACSHAAVYADVPAPTRGFEVDTSSRSSVVSFYQSIYQASEGYRDRIGWTGNYTSTAAGAEGTTSAVFVGDIERRLNYFRALSGVPADVRVNTGSVVKINAADAYKPDATTTKAAAAQRSALMIARTYPSSNGLNHNPPQSNTAWTSAAWNANKNGNLSLGFYGPGAVDAYMEENVAGISSWNLDVGHRRWLLSQWSTDFASGDTPGAFSGNTVYPPTNAMYVMPQQGDVNFDIVPRFHSLPSAGYFPAEHNSPYWSLSYHKADFSAATVTMRDAAMNVLPVSVVSRRTGYGDNSLVWQVPASASVSSVTADTTFHVTVSGIQGTDVPTQYTYQVTLMDPNRLNQSGTVSGDGSPLATGATYQIGGLGGVEQVEAGTFLRKPATWIEGAEASPSPKVIARTHSSYPFLAAVSGYVKSGAKAFRLTFPTRYDPFINGVPQQSFELDREIIAGSASTLTFQYRRGLMTAASKLAVESSSDGGYTWTNLTTISGGGSSVDAAFQAASLPLPSSGAPVRVRFRFYLSDSTASLYSHEDQPTQPTGIFLDDIGVTGCDWLEPWGTVKAAGLGSFTFNSTTAGTAIASGTWWLRARAYLGGKAFPWGAAKVVTPRGPLELGGSITPPVSGANYSFTGDPVATSYRFEVSAPGGSAWTEGAETAPPPQISTQTSSAYAVLSNLADFRKSGSRSFRLGLSTLTDPEDLFTVERNATPSATSALEFWTRRGPMALTNRLHVELSSDGGNTWTSIWNLPGTKQTDPAVTRQTVSLSAWAGNAVKFRFALRNTGGNNLAWNASKSGVWLDDITVTAPSLVLWSKETTLPAGATSVSLNDLTAGRPLVAGQILQLRLRPMYGATPGAWGPTLLVTTTSASPVLTGFAAFQAEYPSENLVFEGDADGDGSADGIEYAFSTDPTRSSPSGDSISITHDRLKITRDLPTEREDVNYGAEWSSDLATWSDEGVEVRIEGGKIIASAPRVGPLRVMRWAVLQK